MKKVMKKRAGFTLVELLIVIIIIGILAGAMLLVAGSGTDKAEATKIVSNLRSLKAAALMWYSDNPSATIAEVNTATITGLEKYMDREVKAPAGNYVFVSTTVGSDDLWWVGLEGDTYPAAGVQTKLAGIAEETGLYANTASADVNYTSGFNMYMRAR